MNSSQIIFILLIVNIPVFFLIGKIFFSTWERFTEALKAHSRSRRIFMDSQQRKNDQTPAMAMALFMISCMAVIFVEMFLYRWVMTNFIK